MSQVRNDLGDRVPDTITLVWVQGETDARLGLVDVYEKALQAVIKRLRDDLDRDDLFVVIARISDHGRDRTYARFWTLTRLIQVDVAEMDPYAAWVNTDDLNGEDHSLRYPARALKPLGTRLAERAVKLIATTPPPS